MRGNLVVKSSSSSSKNNNNNYSVMLRFRPIAPKPPGGEHSSEAVDLAKTNGSVKRTKRKYVRVRSRQTKRKNTETPTLSPEEPSHPPPNTFTTLQLLPERSESEQICSAEENLENNSKTQVDEVNGQGYTMDELKSLRSAVDTWIIVEQVTETFTNNNYDGVGLGFTDKDRVSNLEMDTCPGFVSDGNNKVVWVNQAYRRMVHETDGSGVCVSLVLNENLPYFCPSFACRVRLIQQGQKWNKIVACDVWRMDFQGFAWKLDVNTALTL